MDINASRVMQAETDGEEKMHNVARWRDAPVFSEAERLALEFAEKATITGQRVEPELIAKLKKHFDDSQIVELSAAVALENFRSKFNVPLGVEAQGFCIVPAR
ncbi:MAG: carboxymuconolactone decarboxylase family protein [Alphaproteobacteria bacterium]|nr:carboxymuconolactone decarboxylase family protein [Alphaproteobacteria bacterium]